MSIYDYDPDQNPTMSKEQRDEMMKKFLEKGGKVQKLKPGYPTNVGSLDKSRKPAFTKEDNSSVSPSENNPIYILSNKLV